MHAKKGKKKKKGIKEQSNCHWKCFIILIQEYDTYFIFKMICVLFFEW